MTTAPPLHQAVPHALPAPSRLRGERLRRRQERRKVLREQVIVAVVLLFVLAVTLGVLALQWLSSPSSSSSGSLGAVVHTVVGAST